MLRLIGNSIEQWDMPQPQVAPSLFLTERPLCPVCEHRMVLEQIEPDKPGYDRRTFECPSCEHVETVVVRYG